MRLHSFCFLSFEEEKHSMVSFLSEPKLCCPDCLPNASDLLIFGTSIFFIDLSVTACDKFMWQPYSELVNKGVIWCLHYPYNCHAVYVTTKTIKHSKKWSGDNHYSVQTQYSGRNYSDFLGPFKHLYVCLYFLIN